MAAATVAPAAAQRPQPGGDEGASGAPSADAEALVRRAAWLMGGEQRLRDVRLVSFDMMTQWMRTGFRAVPWTDRPSFEPHRDVRDYSIPAWRNTRDFGAVRVTNIIRDSISVTDQGDGFRPLSVAYVDERDELFTYTPDRLVLALLDATRLSLLPDTAIGDEPHRAVRARLGPGHGHVRQVDVFFHAGSGLPTMLRFTAAHPADYGLVQWGAMDVEVWYSSWATFGDVSIPRQWDIMRVGVPYKRMTVQRADFAPDFAADSFAVSDALRDAYFASDAARPMHEARTVQAVERPAEGFAYFEPAFGPPVATVDVGTATVLLGAGRAPFNFEDALASLAESGLPEPTTVLLARTTAGNGGVLAAAERGMELLVSESAEPHVRRVLDNGGATGARLEVIRSARVLGSGPGALYLEPIDLPDVPGSLLVFRPVDGWLWIPDGTDPLSLRMARERAETLGWDVRVIGGPRGTWQEVGPRP